MPHGDDFKWLLGQGVAVFFAVVLLAMFWKLGMLFMGMFQRLIAKVEAMHVEQVKSSGQLVGAFRWLSEVIRKKLNVDPPVSPSEGFEHHRDSEEETRFHRRNGDKPGAPGRAADTGQPTPRFEDFQPPIE
jgi:hypothetical protein